MSPYFTSLCSARGVRAACQPAVNTLASGAWQRASSASEATPGRSSCTPATTRSPASAATSPARPGPSAKPRPSVPVCSPRSTRAGGRQPTRRWPVCWSAGWRWPIWPGAPGSPTRATQPDHPADARPPAPAAARHGHPGPLLLGTARPRRLRRQAAGAGHRPPGPRDPAAGAGSGGPLGLDSCQPGGPGQPTPARLG
jgi:hypothetical protein